MTAHAQQGRFFSYLGGNTDTPRMLTIFLCRMLDRIDASAATFLIVSAVISIV